MGSTTKEKWTKDVNKQFRKEYSQPMNTQTMPIPTCNPGNAAALEARNN